MLVLIGNGYGKLEVFLHRLGVQETTVDGQVPGRHTVTVKDELALLHLLLTSTVMGDIALSASQIRQLTGGYVGPLGGIVFPTNALLGVPLLLAFHGEG